MGGDAPEEASHRAVGVRLRGAPSPSGEVDWPCPRGSTAPSLFAPPSSRAPAWDIPPSGFIYEVPQKVGKRTAPGAGQAQTSVNLHLFEPNAALLRCWTPWTDQIRQHLGTTERYIWSRPIPSNQKRVQSWRHPRLKTKAAWTRNNNRNSVGNRDPQSNPNIYQANIVRSCLLHHRHYATALADASG